jgi:hypothetical protein
MRSADRAQRGHQRSAGGESSVLEFQPAARGIEGAKELRAGHMERIHGFGSAISSTISTARATSARASPKSRGRTAVEAEP